MPSAFSSTMKFNVRSGNTMVISVHGFPQEVKLAVPAKGLFLWNIKYEFNKN